MKTVTDDAGRKYDAFLSKKKEKLFFVAYAPSSFYRYFFPTIWLIFPPDFKANGLNFEW